MGHGAETENREQSLQELVFRPGDKGVVFRHEQQRSQPKPWTSSIHCFCEQTHRISNRKHHGCLLKIVGPHDLIRRMLPVWRGGMVTTLITVIAWFGRSHSQNPRIFHSAPIVFCTATGPETSIRLFERDVEKTQRDLLTLKQGFSTDRPIFIPSHRSCRHPQKDLFQCKPVREAALVATKQKHLSYLLIFQRKQCFLWLVHGELTFAQFLCCGTSLWVSARLRSSFDARTTA